MRVPHLAAIDHGGHLHARAQLVRLRFDREDADVAGLHVVEDRARHVLERPRREFFEHEHVVVVDAALQLMRQARSDFQAGDVRDQRDLLVRLDAQAGLDRVAGAGAEVRVECEVA